MSAGVLRPGIWNVFVDAGLPKHPKSDTAFIEFVDEKDGWVYGARPSAERKRYRLPVDVSPLKRLSTGRYKVTFSIQSLTEAKLWIEKKNDS